MTVELQAYPRATVRKPPRQGRSKDTVAAILEAGGRLLEHRGEAAVTTAAVARLAGCSIGTLYQYFADRDEILIALVDREQQRIVDTFRSLAAGGRPWPSSTARALVRALIASYKARRGARRHFELVMTLDAREGKNPLVDAIAQQMCKHHPSDGAGGEEVRARAFVLTRAMLGVLRAAALEDSALLMSPAFEDSLCLMWESLWRPVIEARRAQDAPTPSPAP